MSKEIKDIAKEAENVIAGLKRDKWNNLVLKTNQIRKFLSAVNTVSNKVDVYKSKHQYSDMLSDELAAEVKYLKVKLVYQVGRDTSRDHSVKDFVDGSRLIERIEAVGNSISKYRELANYMEALVAYHKFNGGKD